ncbi:MBL fold metallo-hydrolase [Litoribacillus peritrichatus]|uniref:MBL fold metallo-hydrolase n=1 Tax=Litoribacillus peritrichatus TaxID=718191 RepID=A0ABP7MNY8_9GAMM
MKAQKIYQGNHDWVLFGRDPHKPDKIIDTNQYMIVADGQALLLDPGGIELFSSMFASVLKHVKPEQVTALFASHQDPDIISSLGLWDQVIPNAKLYSPWLWEGFIRHFGMENIEYSPIKDEGGSFKLGSLELQFIPAHYLHSSGNMHIYDPVAKILFSGDIGAALEHGDFPLYVEDFDQQIDKMRYFHQRWMPSNQAKQNWINRVRQLDIEFMCPQHGRIFKGEQVQTFLNWFEALEVGIAVN